MNQLEMIILRNPHQTAEDHDNPGRLRLSIV